MQFLLWQASAVRRQAAAGQRKVAQVEVNRENMTAGRRRTEKVGSQQKQNGAVCRQAAAGRRKAVPADVNRENTPQAGGGWAALLH